MTASLALYLGDGSCCLYDVSCSSSTIINPRSLNGRKTEDLAPTISLAVFLFFFMLSQTSVRSLSEYLEWNTEI